MKAILNVKSNNLYENHNGLTYEVNENECSSTHFALELPMRGPRYQLQDGPNVVTVKFLLKEVLIVDFAKELKQAAEESEWGGRGCDYKYKRLQQYAKEKGIRFDYPF